MKSIKTLLLYAQQYTTLSYYDDWKDAFTTDPSFEVTTINICQPENVDVVRKSITGFDLVVLLHSTNADGLDFLRPFKEALNLRKCKLLTFVGNEVNLPGAFVGDKIAMIKEIRAEYIGTQLPLAAGKWLYEECKDSVVVDLPHALNPKAFSSTIPQKDRKIDIGVRTHRYSPYLGDNDRNDLIDYVVANKEKYGLAVDVDFQQRFDRADWAAFLNGLRSTIATEAGSLFLERDDRTIKAIMEYTKKKFNEGQPGKTVIRKGSLVQRLGMLAPAGLRKKMKKMLGVVNDEEVMFQNEYNDIFDKFYRNYPPNPIHTKAISSRHFDAIGTKTCQLMFDGKFNDILLADVHYISLKKDFSNLADCVRKLKDDGFRTKMTDDTYDYVMSNHTYSHRTQKIANMI